MSNLPFKNGEIIRLSAIGEFYTKSYWDDDIEGIYLKLNDKIYAICEDPDDGYRSYGRISEGIYVDDEGNEVKNQYVEIPEQLLLYNYEEVQESDEYGFDTNYWKIVLTNPKTHKEVLVIGTDFSDSYYPCAIYRWNPQNLPINEGK